ncbi:DUF1592 domain-containing protein [Enhygromyxa salina]|uniref:DUF1592 domain-containing protein n=1 Tax=Enhygromyxa salina TaxID=215803 RepID=UPI0011BAAFBE|nr:DUF1592 domain-containing protein [Enhygromyxa salina]
MNRLTWAKRLAALALGCALPACYVGVDASAGDAGDGDTGTGTGQEGNGDGDGDGDESQPIESTRFARLSHGQWENTVRDLFVLPEQTGFSSLFIGDATSGKFDNDSAALDVTPTLWADYQRAAEQVADYVTSDALLLAAIVPDDLPEDAGDPSVRAKAWIAAFGARAYRRPLTGAEVDAHYFVFEQGVDLYDALDPFTAGVHMCIQAFLQSPHFVYRVETSETVGADGLIHLGGYEVATRLSYMLWNSMPDQTLFDAAAEGELDDAAGVLVQAARMIDDPRAQDMVTDFHAQLLDTDHYLDQYKDPNFYPLFDAAITGAAMQRETELFVNSIVFDDQGGLAELLTAPYTFVNQDTAYMYGLGDGFGPEHERVMLDATQRSGILTQVGFLSSNAYPVDPDSIHRGVSVVRNLLCAPLPPPPDNVPPLPPTMGNTNRERVEAHTGDGTCGEGCHSGVINPVGFAFEGYDAIGQWREQDNGFPIDDSDTFYFDAEPKSYDGAAEFGKHAAASTQVHACYVGHLLEYAYARDVAAQEKAIVNELAARSRDGALPIRALLLELTQTQSFATRYPLEAGQ